MNFELIDFLVSTKIYNLLIKLSLKYSHLNFFNGTIPIRLEKEEDSMKVEKSRVTVDLYLHYPFMGWEKGKALQNIVDLEAPCGARRRVHRPNPERVGRNKRVIIPLTDFP